MSYETITGVNWAASGIKVGDVVTMHAEQHNGRYVVIGFDGAGTLVVEAEEGPADLTMPGHVLAIGVAVLLLIVAAFVGALL